MSEPRKVSDHITELFEARMGKQMEMTCEKHGEYVGYERLQECPDCFKEKEEGLRKEEDREHRRAIIRQRWEKAGMPPKFCGIMLRDWIADTDDKLVALEAGKLFASGGIARMLLIGNCGTGKTMLAAGVIGEMTMQGKEPVYITSTRLVRSIRETWINKTSEQEAMDIFIKADVLVIDELGSGRGSDDERLYLSEVLCDRYAMDKPTLLISNLTGEELKESVLDERAVDRMREDGQVVTMNWESFRK